VGVAALRRLCIACPAELRRAAAAMLKASFRDQGIAKVDRLQQDASNGECSAAEGKPLAEARAKAIEAANLATVKMPADGKYIGDWQAGERWRRTAEA
jgi:sulfur-oxidizing protein SoxX